MTTKLSQQARELRELLAKATAGPWRVEAFNEVIAGEPDYSAFVLGSDDITILAQRISDDDAELIVAAVNALPALLDSLSPPDTPTDVELRLALEAGLEHAIGAWNDCKGAGIEFDNCKRDVERIERALASIAVSPFSPCPTDVERQIADDMADQANRWRNRAGDLMEALTKLETASLRVVRAMDKYNEKHGTFIGGAPFFELGRAIATARASLSEGDE